MAETDRKSMDIRLLACYTAILEYFVSAVVDLFTTKRVCEEPPGGRDSEFALGADSGIYLHHIWA